jgi:hypothetical protein
MVGEATTLGTSRANTLGRPGQIFEYDFGRQIGINLSGNPTSTLRVVADSNGVVKTAFPY